VRAGYPRALRLASSTACSALLLATAGCGSGESRTPELPQEAGTALASATSDVTAALEAGDPVLAQAEVEELLAAVEAALAGGDVPRPLAAEVRRGAERLAALVDAAQPPPPAPPAPEPPPEENQGEDDEDDENDEDDEADGPGKGKGKDKKDKGNKDKDDDD
jgi:hypothetical protein